MRFTWKKNLMETRRIEFNELHTLVRVEDEGQLRIVVVGKY